MLTYDFRLPPGPDTVELALLAEELGYRRVWCPEVPAFGHDIWITLARVAERTSRIGVGAAVLVPSYRHPVAQASAIATVEAVAPGRLAVGFGTGFTGRGGLGQPPLTLAAMRAHITQVRALLDGEAVEIDGAMAKMLPFTGWHPDYPIRVPLLFASQGPKGRRLAAEIADGLITMGAPANGFNPSLVSINGSVLDDGEDISSARVQRVLAPLVATAYHATYMRDPEQVKSFPNGDAWLASVLQVPAAERHLSVYFGEKPGLNSLPADSVGWGEHSQCV
jgi:5,10-methylenetetrahydromethanopterin reductase